MPNDLRTHLQECPSDFQNIAARFILPPGLHLSGLAQKYGIMRCMDPDEITSEDKEATLPSPATSTDSPPQKGLSAIHFIRKRRLPIALSALFLVLSLASGALLGYFMGTRQGQEMKSETIRAVTDEQYRLALEDLNAGKYDLARQRLEYISRLDPAYPGIAEALAQALLALNAPTVTPMVLATPTPNLAPVEELFEQAKAAFREGNWTLALEHLLALRAKDARYLTLEVDRLMFSSLRNRGVQRISVNGQLEEGIYDLTRAQLFGPLDRDADNWRSWAELYLLANSYMGVDWAQASYYFAQVYLIAPYLKNDAYIKYAISAHAYGDQLVMDSDPCAAQEQYLQSLQVWENPELLPTATKAAEACLTATAFVPAPPPVEETPTPTETPTDEQTPAPIETP